EDEAGSSRACLADRRRSLPCADLPGAMGDMHTDGVPLPPVCLWSSDRADACCSVAAVGLLEGNEIRMRRGRLMVAHEPHDLLPDPVTLEQPRPDVRVVHQQV